jgi:hypothetical protein
LESPNTWWSIALSYYQLGLYEQAANILKTKQMPVQKSEERQLLLQRCSLLRPDNPNTGYTGAAVRHMRAARKLFYMALVRNDDKAAGRWLQRMQRQLAQERKQLDRSNNSANAAAPIPDSTSELILNLHTYLLKESEPHDIPLNLSASAYSALWGELYFLYLLAAKEHLFALQTQVQTYWRQLLLLLPDPLLRLKGRYELIKTVHVRIYQLLRNENGDLEYAALWDEVRPRLMTLIDDLLMEEVN